LRADAARNRAALLAAATEVFRERGVDASVLEIAERAGVGKATLFRNFASKQDLIVAVVAARMREGIATGAAELEAGGDQELLFPFVSQVVELQQQDRSLFEVVGEDDFLSHPDVAAAHTEFIEVLDGMIEHDVALGYVRPGIGGMDVLMLVKGACAVAQALADAGPASLERHLSFVRAALSAPGRDLPLTGSAPTLTDLHVPPPR
jgi:AcrR family transcriptional regulator